MTKTASSSTKKKKDVATTTTSTNDNGSGDKNGNKNGTNKKKEKKTSNPKSVLDKIIYAIRESPPGTNGAVSRVLIGKYLKNEFQYDNSTQIKLAIKKGVTKGTLTQRGQSFLVTKDPPRVPAGLNDVEPLQIEDVKIGKGTDDGDGDGDDGDGDDSMTANRGDTVTVQYVGKLKDGTTFDSAKKFEFVLGAGDVIKGWDQGLIGMKIDGKRKLIVPSHLGYGKRGCSPDIPPNATLYFDITMKKIVKS